MMKNISRLLIILIGGALLSSCSRLSLMVFLKPPSAFKEAAIPPAPDYSSSRSWHKWRLRNLDKKVDVFYVHPTTYISGKGWNQDLENQHVNWRTRVLALAYQAKTFYDDCRIFIPKYRQAIFYSFVDKKDNGQKALDIAYVDVRDAFFYYLKHRNKGRPFIIASHSQGSYHCQKLLAEVLKDSVIKSQLVVGYIVGWPVTGSYLTKNPQVEVCSTSTQTGCIVSWNTESGNPKLSLVREVAQGESILCVNPLTWTLDSTYVPNTENKGSLQYNKQRKEDEIILHYCDAQIKDGTLKVTPPANQQHLQMPMGKGNYHLYDYNFFYQNIKQNIRDRFASYNDEQHLTKDD